ETRGRERRPHRADVQLGEPREPAAEQRHGGDAHDCGDDEQHQAAYAFEVSGSGSAIVGRTTAGLFALCASHQPARSAAGSALLRWKPCASSTPISSSRSSVSASSMPSATVRSARLRASSMVDLTITTLRRSVFMPSTNDLSTFSSFTGSWVRYASDE